MAVSRASREGLAEFWFAMPHYHFDLVSADTTTDVNDAVLDSDDLAGKVGLELAHQVREGRPELIGQGYEILVRDDSGNEIARVSIDQLPSDGDDQ